MKVKLFKTHCGIDSSFQELEDQINDFIKDKKVFSVNISFAPHSSNFYPSGGGHYFGHVMYED